MPDGKAMRDADDLGALGYSVQVSKEEDNWLIPEVNSSHLLWLGSGPGSDNNHVSDSAETRNEHDWAVAARRLRFV